MLISRVGGCDDVDQKWFYFDFLTQVKMCLSIGQEQVNATT